MCLRCGVIQHPYRRWPAGPSGPGDYGPPPELSPPQYGAAPTGGLFGIGARPRLPDGHRLVGTGPARSAATSSPGCASSGSQPSRYGRGLARGRPQAVPAAQAVARPSEGNQPRQMMATAEGQMPW
jgi:hypothetical protein